MTYARRATLIWLSGALSGIGLLLIGSGLYDAIHRPDRPMFACENGELVPWRSDKSGPDEITIPGMWAGPAAAALVPELVLGHAHRSPSWIPAAWPDPAPTQQPVVGYGFAVSAAGWLRRTRRANSGRPGRNRLT